MWIKIEDGCELPSMFEDVLVWVGGRKKRAEISVLHNDEKVWYAYPYDRIIHPVAWWKAEPIPDYTG